VVVVCVLCVLVCLFGCGGLCVVVVCECFCFVVWL
jgi:hypothetical protein